MAHDRLVHALPSPLGYSRERCFIEGFAALSEKRRQDENEDQRAIVIRASGLFPLALALTLTLPTAASK
jgi:hypothetical protein